MGKKTKKIKMYSPDFRAICDEFERIHNIIGRGKDEDKKSN